MIRITEKGMRKHLEEKVFAGDAEHPIMEILLDKEKLIGFGILREDDLGFYLQLCKRINIASDIMEVTDEIYRIKSDSIIAIPSKDYLRFYYFNLFRK